LRQYKTAKKKKEDENIMFCPITYKATIIMYMLSKG